MATGTNRKEGRYPLFQTPFSEACQTLFELSSGLNVLVNASRGQTSENSVANGQSWGSGVKLAKGTKLAILNTKTICVHSYAMLQLVHSRTTVQLSRRLKTTISSIKRGNPLLGRKFMKNYLTYPTTLGASTAFLLFAHQYAAGIQKAEKNKRLKRIHREFERTAVKATEGTNLANSQQIGAS